MKSNDINSSTIINDVQNKTIASENNQKKNKKKKIIKTILIVIGVFLVLDIVIGIMGAIFSDDSNNSSLNVQTIDDSRWAKLSDTSVGYGYKETPEKFVENIKEFFNNFCSDYGETGNALDYYNSLTYLDKIQNDNFDEYIYTYSLSDGNMGYYIDYNGKYISEAKAIVSLDLANSNPSKTKTDLCVGVVSVLYAYGADLEDEDFWELQSRIDLEISNKANDFPNSQLFCRYDDFIISYYSDGQYTITMSVFKTNGENINKIEESLGYSLVDVKKNDTTGDAHENGIINSNTAKNSTSGTQKSIDVFDLFESLERAKSLLGNETQPSKDVGAYTQYYFKNIVIQCVYNTNRIYSVSIDYGNDDLSENLKVNGIGSNSSYSDYEEAFEDLDYFSYDNDGNRLYGYKLKNDDKSYYIEITLSEEKTEKISVYYEDVEY